MKTIVNINVCIEVSEPAEMLNDAATIEKQVIETLGLVESPVLGFNIDVDVFEVDVFETGE